MSSIDLPNKDDPLLSRLAFGVGRLHKHDLGTAYRTVRAAYDHGIRHFDTSVYYGFGLGQTVLGQLIADVGDRDTLFISTKIGHFQKEFPGAKDLYRNEEALWGLVHECYRQLRGPIDLLQIHEADLALWWDSSEPEEGRRFVQADVEYEFRTAPVMRALGRARDSGVCRYTGATGNTSEALSRVVSAIDVDTVMCAYNLDPIFRGAQANLLPVVRERGLFYLSAGLLQGGSYVRPRNFDRWYHRDERIVERFTRYAEIQEESGLTGAELVSRWMLSVPDVGCWVLGASHPDQVDETMRVLRKGPLPADLQAALDALALPGVDPFSSFPG